MRRVMRGGVVCLVWLQVGAAGGQMGDHAPVPPTWNQRPGSSPTPNVRATDTSAPGQVDVLRAKQMESLNAKHLLQAKEDAAKLLDLATELKKEVDGMGGGVVSAKASADAEKIAGLAKSVKGNLKTY